MIVPKFYATIQKGRLTHEDPGAFASYLVTQFDDGQEVELTVKKRYKRRTQGAPGEETNFNGYYWGVIVRMIADEIGEIGADGYNRTHAWIQVNVGNFKAMPDGKVIPAGTKLKSGADFAEMCSKARMWASIPKDHGGLGIYIPEPHEAEYEE